MDDETRAELAQIRETLATHANRGDLNAEQLAHNIAAQTELRAIVIGPGPHALTDRIPRAEASIQGLTARADASDTRNAMQQNEDAGGFWGAIIKASSKAGQVYGALPLLAQVTIWITGIVALLLLSDGGRELLRLLLTGSADIPVTP